ncbi:Solute carrier family 40 member 2, chloroplastic [Dendrobium catenatum]|uniref:Solute carrier family 40 member n=1 Tax=Dendrobium catenatum TaxID=906689 RepID=A0A2I0WB33_9ASPA|nr:Solute carrier family 40 member 2, chloroplastic [Dendrobium catenatum]
MRLLIFPSFSQPPLLRRGKPLVSQYRLRQWYPISFHSKRPPGYSVYRFGGFSSKCSVVDVDVDASSIATEDETSEDLTSCSNTLSPLASDIFYSASFKSLKEDDCINSLLREVPVLTKDEQAALAATPAHPAGLYALYASFLVGNMVEQLWNFAWPTAVATLHTSLLPVAFVGFFAKLSVFIGAPLVGNLMDHFPRIPAYHSLNIIQTAAQLLSAAMIIHALSRASCSSASTMLFQPWFIVLVAVGAIERLAGLALGVTVEREWVVLVIG